MPKPYFLEGERIPRPFLSSDMFGNGSMSSHERPNNFITLNTIRAFSQQPNASLFDFIASREENAYKKITSLLTDSKQLSPLKRKIITYDDYIYELARRAQFYMQTDLSFEDQFAFFVFDVWRKGPKYPKTLLTEKLNVEPWTWSFFLTHVLDHPKLNMFLEHMNQDDNENVGITIEQIQTFSQLGKTSLLSELIASRPEEEYQEISLILRNINLPVMNELSYRAALALNIQILDSLSSFTLEQKFSFFIVDVYQNYANRQSATRIEDLEQRFSITEATLDILNQYLEKNQENWQLYLDFKAMALRMREKGYVGVPTEFQFCLTQVINEDTDIELTWGEIMSRLAPYAPSPFNYSKAYSKEHPHYKTYYNYITRHAVQPLIAYGEIDHEKIFNREYVRQQILFQKILNITFKFEQKDERVSAEQVASILEKSPTTVRRVARKFGKPFPPALFLDQTIPRNIQRQIIEEVVKERMKETGKENVLIDEEIAERINFKLSVLGYPLKGKKDVKFYRNLWSKIHNESEIDNFIERKKN